MDELGLHFGFEGGCASKSASPAIGAQRRTGNGQQPFVALGHFALL